MFETGLAIFLALLLVFAKLPQRFMLRLLHYDIVIDIFVTMLVLLIHFGTFSGLMAATVAGLMTSVATTAAKRLFGFIRGNQYFPGYVRLEV